MIFVLLVLCILIADPAYAYVDPGSTVALTTILGVIGSILAGFFGVIFYPVKRVLQKWKARKESTTKQSEKSN